MFGADDYRFDEGADFKGLEDNKNYIGNSLFNNITDTVVFSNKEANNTIIGQDTKKEDNQDMIDAVKKELSKYLKLSGYVMGRGIYSDNKNNYGGFDIRFCRLIGAGNITKDFSYRVQIELAGNPRLLDAWLMWKKYDFFSIKAGQMKRPFSLESPISPTLIGVSEYSIITTKLAGFTDRVGEHMGGNRDGGVILAGDFVKVNKRNLFRYEVGIFNGTGINKKDDNNFKDLIGSLYFIPLKEFRIGGGGWLGKFGPKGNEVDRKRWNIGTKYDSNKLFVLSEYTSSKGGIVGKENAPLKSDGWYVLAGTPVLDNVKLFVKYEGYRDNKEWNSLQTRYHCALNWDVHKSIMLQIAYFFTNERTNRNNYNTTVGQVVFRF
jgi:Phosphate-selective porin O and P.